MLCGKFVKFCFMAACISSGLLYGMVAVDSKIEFEEQLRRTKDLVVQERPDWLTETHAAVVLGFPDVLRHLLQITGTELKNKSGATPLHFAAEGKVEAVLILLDHNANVEARTDGNQLTPLHFAVMAGNGEVVMALLKARAPVNAMAPSGTPLILACEQEILNLDIIKALLRFEADVNLPDSDGLLPLDRALLGWRGYCSAENDEIDAMNGFYRPLIMGSLVELLLEKGAQFHGYMNNPEFNEVTLWHILARHDNNIELLRLLLPHSREHLNVQLNGQTPLDIAMEKENSRVATLLRQFGACSSKESVAPLN